jgi:transposase
MTILPDLSDLVIEQISITNEVTITVHAVSPTAPCPCCGTISKRVQSRYTRTLRDLPASGRPVHLIVRVRRSSAKSVPALVGSLPNAFLR